MLITGNIECQPPEKLRKVSDNNQSSYPKENAFVCADDFSQKSSNLLSQSEKFFRLEEYRITFKYLCRSFFIEDFCTGDQLPCLQHIGIYWSEEWDEGIFARLETHLKRVILENVEVKNNNYDTVKNMLGPKRTKGLFYHLIYSFYETGMIGLQRSNSAVEKILFNIVAHTCLMAHVNNDNVKRALQSKSEMPKFVQNDFSQSNFRYTDFTKVLQGGSLPKKDMFLINADKLKKETNDNIQLIINREFDDNPEYKRL